MRYLLDTNVLSELVRPAPAPAVVGWVGAQSPLDLAVSVLTIGEIEKGIWSLPDGARRRELIEWASTRLAQQFVGRMLPIDHAISAAWGRLAAEGKRHGRTLPVIDGLLLATAQVHGLTLVTRDTGDCTGYGVPVHDPWRPGE